MLASLLPVPSSLLKPPQVCGERPPSPGAGPACHDHPAEAQGHVLSQMPLPVGTLAAAGNGLSWPLQVHLPVPWEAELCVLCHLGPCPPTCSGVHEREERGAETVSSQPHCCCDSPVPPALPQQGLLSPCGPLAAHTDWRGSVLHSGLPLALPGPATADLS